MRGHGGRVRSRLVLRRLLDDLRGSIRRGHRTTTREYESSGTVEVRGEPRDDDLHNRKSGYNVTGRKPLERDR